MLRKHNVRRRLFHEALEARQLLDASGLAHGEPVSDFAIVDVNATSATFNQSVSPRDFEGQTTAWYLIRSW